MSGIPTQKSTARIRFGFTAAPLLWPNAQTNRECHVRLCAMPSRLRPFVPAIVFVLIVISAYAILRSQREELVDFVVPHTAAVRFLTHEPLYRPDDGHYQYKYLPAFAVAMVPFTWLPNQAAELTWFTLTVAMAWAFVKISIAALPDRRLSVRVLFWLTLLLNGKFLVKELGVRTVQFAGGAAPGRRGDRRPTRAGTDGRRPGRGWGVRQAVCADPGAVAGIDDGLARVRAVRPGDGRRAAAAGRHSTVGTAT